MGYQNLSIFLLRILSKDPGAGKAVGMGQIYGLTWGFEGLFQPKWFYDRFFILFHHLAYLEGALKLWGFQTFFCHIWRERRVFKAEKALRHHSRNKTLIPLNVGTNPAEVFLLFKSSRVAFWKVGLWSRYGSSAYFYYSKAVQWQGTAGLMRELNLKEDKALKAEIYNLYFIKFSSFISPLSFL